MQPQILVKSEDVQHRLLSMGIPLRALMEALRKGIAASNSCTANDPINAPGWEMWKGTTRGLREELLPLGWSRENPEGQPLTLSPGRERAILTAGGTASTGVDGFEQPATRAIKGPRTISAVQRNSGIQPDLLEDYFPVPKPAPGIETWLLLHCRDEEVLRSELSLPTSYNDRGVIDGWQTRLILPTLRFGGPSLDDLIPLAPRTPEVVVPVVRRA